VFSLCHEGVHRTWKHEVVRIGRVFGVVQVIVKGSFQSDIMPCHGIQRHDTECARAALPGTICAECPPGAKQRSEEQRRREEQRAAKPCCHAMLPRHVATVPQLCHSFEDEVEVSHGNVT